MRGGLRWIFRQLELLLTDYFSSMCDKVSVRHVVLHLIVCFALTVCPRGTSTSTVKDFSLSSYCGHLCTLLLIKCLITALPSVFFTLSDTIRRSTVGGETPNKIHHRAQLSLKTWQAVFMSGPSAVSGGQAPSRHKNTQETLRGFWYHTMCLHVNLVTSKQAKLA